MPPVRLHPVKKEERVQGRIAGRPAQSWTVEMLEKVLQTKERSYDLKGQKTPKQYLLRELVRYIAKKPENDLSKKEVDEILGQDMDSTATRRYQMLDKDGEFVPSAYPLGKVPLGKEDMLDMLTDFKAQLKAELRPNPHVEGILKTCAGCRMEHGEIQYPEMISEACNHDDIPFCRGCIAQHLRETIDGGDKMAVDCPECHQTLSADDVKKLVPTLVYKLYGISSFRRCFHAYTCTGTARWTKTHQW